MQAFTLDEHYSIVCEYQSRRGGFRHVATLLLDGIECDTTKITYVNRTWERFTYESVLVKMIDKHFFNDDRTAFLAAIYAHHGY